jgi:predicted DNA-binding transcriptional regulator AlpA
MSKQNENKPERGFLRLPQVIGNPKAKPPIAARIPVSKSTWWSGIREGRYPKPVKLSARTSAWRESDIDALCDQLASQSEVGQ